MNTSTVYNFSTDVSGSATFTCNCGVTESSPFESLYITYPIVIPIDNAVAEITCPGGNLIFQINKKLHWLQKICYNILGFKYKKL